MLIPDPTDSASKKKSTQKVFAATWSPTLSKAQQNLQTKIEMDRLRQELADKEKLIQDQQITISSLQNERNLYFNREEMYTEDIKVKEFYIAIQDQKIAQLEEELSSQRLEKHEAVSKIKRYKVSLKQLHKEREELESKSSNLITQLNEQMVQLQKLAIDRIQVSVR
jgi:chromosome segregation ATPase